MEERGGMLLEEILGDCLYNAEIVVTDELKEQVITRFHDIERKLQQQPKIYLSYTSKHCRCEDVFEIANRLSQHEFTVLIDKNPQREQTLEEKFQRPIDESDVFVVFFNDDYKMSDLCAAEVVYAERRNKRMLVLGMDNKEATWGRWLNFYLSEHLWMAMVNDENQAIAMNDFLPNLVERINQILTQPPPRACKFTNITSIDVPSFPKYLSRPFVEDCLLERLKSTCKSPEDGIMLVVGAGGLGKTTHLAQVLLDRNRDDFLTRDCGLHVVIWLNCLEWPDAATFTEIEQRAFIDRLLGLGKRAASADPAFSTIQFFEIEGILQHFRKLKKGVLFVLDNVSNVKLAECFRKNSPLAACCVLSRQYEPSKAWRRKVYEMPPFSDRELVELMEQTFGLEGKLTQKQFQALAKRCYGLPLIAALVASRISDCDAHMYDLECQVICSETFSPIPLPFIRELFEHNMRRAELRDRHIRRLYFAFLMFEPGEPVCVDDLAIMWGFEGGNFKRGVLKTRGLCRVLENKNLIIRLQDYSTAKEDYFAVHQLIYQAALCDAKTFFDTPTFEKLRMKLASGSCHAGFLEEDNVAMEHEKISLISILAEAVLQKRRNLLEKIVEKIDPRGLAELCGQKAEKTAGRTFLHFLYNTEWPDNVMLRWNIHLGANYSYRLIERILKKIFNLNIPLDEALTGTDSNYDSFLTDIFDQENDSLFSQDRLRILALLSRWRGEYEDCKAEKQRMVKFGFHPAITFAALGNFDEVKHQFSLPSIADPTTEAEIDKSELVQATMQVAARHGHQEIFRFLHTECCDPTNVQPNELSKAFMLAAANGHLDIVSWLYGEQKCTSFDQDENSMTALMFAARGGHLAIVEYLFVYAENVEVLSLKDKNGFTALMYAANHGHERVVEALARLNPEVVPAQTSDNWTAFSFAASNGYLTILKLLYRYHSEAVKLPTKKDSLLPAMLAARNGHFETVKFLLQKYREAANLKDANDWPMLMHAIFSGNLALASHVADLNPAALAESDLEGQTPLMLASRLGHAPIVNFLIHKKDCRLSMVSNEGMTAFQYAAFNGHLGVVKLLTEKDPSVVEVTTVNGRKCSGLTFAVMKGHLPIVQYLYNKQETKLRRTGQMSLEEEREDHFNLLISAILTGHLEVVTFLCEQHPDTLNYQDGEGQTALMAASAWGYHDVAEYLYSKNPKAIELVDSEEVSCLMRASAKGSLATVQFLAEKYADAAAKPAKNGSSCIMAASKGGHLPVIEFLYQTMPDMLTTTDYEGISTLMLAASQGHVACMEFLYAKGKTYLLTLRDYQGRTALTHAAMCGKVEACKFLVNELHVLVEQTDADMFLPLMHAVVGGHLPAVRYLFGEFPDCTYARDKNQQTPLMLAAALGNLDMVQFLLQYDKESVSLRDAQEDSAFTLAMKYGHVRTFEFLVEHCSSAACAADVEGQTLLTLACRQGMLEMVEIIYTSFPEALDLECHKGKTPLSYAAEAGHLAVVKFLYKENRQSIGRLDRHGNLPLTYAAKQNQLEVVTFLSEHLLPESLEDLLKNGSSNDTIVALCRYAHRLSTPADWVIFLRPFRDTLEFDESVGEHVKSWPNIETNHDLIRNLDILCCLTEGDVTFCQSFLDRGGDVLLAQMFVNFREFVNTKTTTPVGVIRANNAEQQMLRILGNLVNFQELRSVIVCNQELVDQLVYRLLEIDIDGGNDQRPWLSCYIFAIFMLPDQGLELKSFNKDHLHDQVNERLQQWIDLKTVDVSGLTLASFARLKELLNVDILSLSMLRRFALWLIKVFAEFEPKSCKNLLADADMLSTLEDLASMKTGDKFATDLAKRVKKLL